MSAINLESKVAIQSILSPIQISVGSGFPGKSQFETEQIVEMEATIINDLVKPVTFMLKYVFPFPHKIVYHHGTRRLSLRKASWLCKVICTLWQTLILWRLGSKVIPNAKETSEGVLAGVVKIAYILFMVYCVINFMAFWTKGKQFVYILNTAIDFSRDFYLRFQSAPKFRLIRMVAHLSWIYCLTFAVTSHGYGAYLTILHHFTQLSSAEGERTMGYENATEADSRYSLNDYDPNDSIIVYVIIITANILNTFNWTLSFLFVGQSALLFRQLFVIFYWRIQTLNSLNEAGIEFNLPNEIRTFNRIGCLVEKYNEIGSLTILFGSITAVLYISTSVEQLVTGVTNVTQFSLKFQLFLSYIPIMTATLLVSDLHRIAGSFGNVIKDVYGNWKKTSSDKSEALCGIVIVHHDLVTSNIGFKGLGFFTVTYQFVATMLSLTITYSLVAIQWFPQSHPIASNKD